MSGAPGSSVGKRQGVSMDAAIAAHSAKSRAMFLPSRPQRPPQNHGHTRGGAGGPTAAAAPTVTPTAAPAAATGRSKRVESHEGDRRDGHTEEDHGRRNLIESGLTPAQKLRIRAAFDTFDNDGTGFITAKDLRPLLQYLGDHPSSKELQELIILVDADGNGVIDFEEFMTLVIMRSRHAHSEAQVVEAFKMFDEEDSGFVPQSRIQHALKHLIGMRDDQISALIEEARHVSDEAGNIDYRRFVRYLMRTY